MMTQPRPTTIAGAVLLTLALSAAPALAQQASVVGGTSVGTAAAHVSDGSHISTEQTARGIQRAPVGSLLGVPVYVSAPVDAPYNAASAYSTYAGQPGFGPNALLAASVVGSPQ